MTGSGQPVPPVKHTLGAPQFESVNTLADGAGPPPVDIHELLRGNLDREKSAGLHELKPLPPRRSRRRRDYWLSLAAVNSAIVLAVFLPGPSVVSLVSGFSGVVLFSCGLTWIMWFVMDDY
jgi:hypothetical protein